MRQQNPGDPEERWGRRTLAEGRRLAAKLDLERRLALAHQRKIALEKELLREKLRAEGQGTEDPRPAASTDET